MAWCGKRIFNHRQSNFHIRCIRVERILLKGKIGFGIVGVAHHHSGLFGAMARRVPDAELIGVYDKDAGRGRKISTEFGIDYYADIEGLLKREDLNVCIVTCENSLKKELAVQAAKSGKHILCDKPLGMNPTESEQIIRACKNANVKLQVGYLSRYSSQALAAKKAIESGEVGKVKCVIGENRVDVGLVKMLSPWLAKREASR